MQDCYIFVLSGKCFSLFEPVELRASSNSSGKFLKATRLIIFLISNGLKSLDIDFKKYAQLKLRCTATLLFLKTLERNITRKV